MFGPGLMERRAAESSYEEYVLAETDLRSPVARIHPAGLVPRKRSGSGLSLAAAEALRDPQLA